MTQNTKNALLLLADRQVLAYYTMITPDSTVSDHACALTELQIAKRKLWDALKYEPETQPSHTAWEI